MSEPTLDVDAINARYADWYRSNLHVLQADWSDRDPGERLDHCIVRNDVPPLLDEVEASRAKLDAIRALVAAQWVDHPPQVSLPRSILAILDGPTP